ncbi:MAG: glycoside hydrolase [Frankia sp.]|nr:glycoside hydrolase [Frankia sp.]
MLTAIGIGASAPVSAARYPAFSPPLLLGGHGAEPSIRVGPDRQVSAYISAPDPTGLGSSVWTVRETRRGDTVHFTGSKPVKPDQGTGGGDSEISVGATVDPDTGCAPLAYSGLHNIDALDNFTTAVSTDCGKTFSLPNLFATQNTVTDRQWQTFDGRLTNFLLYHKLDTGQIVVSESIDGGMTYVSLSPDGAHGVVDATTLPAANHQVTPGNIVTDYAHPIAGMSYLNGEPVHTLYTTFTAPSDIAANVAAFRGAPNTYGGQNAVYLAKSVDGGLTWTDTQAFASPEGGPRDLNLLFSVVAVDTAGNVYVAWTDQLHVRYVVSTDGGKTFSKPYQVNPDNPRGTTSANAADVMPWMVAGGPGMLDVVWYHGQGGKRGSNVKYRSPGDRDTTWTVAFAQLSHAQRAPRGVPSPTVAEMTLTATPVIKNGGICMNGTACDVGVIGEPGDRSMLDFFQVALDAAGRANIAFTDNGDVRSTVGYIRQNTGRSAWTGKRLAPTRFA